MKNEFVLAFNELLDEKQLPRETIIKALESAMVSAYRKAVVASANQHVEAKLNPDTGSITIYTEKEVVDSVMDERTEVLLEEARKVNPDADYGDLVIVESTPKDFGRVAAQTARQVIQQRIRDAERLDQVSHFETQVGEIISGLVQSITSEGMTIGLDKKAEGTIPRKDMIHGERFRLHDRVRALVVEVKDNPRSPQILLSRTHRDFLRRLLENEVPEIYHGIVEIRSITREPGERAKIAVSATQQGIDPVGACVGLRGVRIQTIVRELHDEKIDVIEWNPDPTIFIAKAISPAKVVGVYLGVGKSATVVVPEDQLSLAIGRDGQNARLAAKLTGWRIDIKNILEAAADIIKLYDSGDSFSVEYENGERERIPSAELFVDEADRIETLRKILAKRSENRNLSAEETDMMNRIVDLIEKRKTARLQEKTVADVIAKLEEKNLTREEIIGKSMYESGLPKYVVGVLKSINLNTFGDLYNRMKTNGPDELFKLQGVTPKVMNEIASLVNFISKYEEIEGTVAPETVETPEKQDALSESFDNFALEDLDGDDMIATDDDEMAGGRTMEETPEEMAEEVPFDVLFNTIQTELTAPAFFSEDDDDEKTGDSSRKKKKKKKNVEVEYDPDEDITTVLRKHRRGDDTDWGW